MGPLEGIKILEFAGIGPAPFCAMMLADQGAEVVRVDRAAGKESGIGVDPKKDALCRGRRSLAVNLKDPQGIALILELLAGADGLLEGFRPGVMERLGLGPDVCLKRNPKLVYGRMTGWGQDGPWAKMAGHDINYIALSGVLHGIGRPDQPPVPPVNLVGDFGGGGMLLAFGMLCALLEAQRSGRGQIVDAAMVDGAALLMTPIHAMRAMGIWEDTRGVNVIDSGAHFYEVYPTKDGKFLSIGAIETQFYAELLEKTGLKDDPDFDNQMNRETWPQRKAKLSERIQSKTRAEWEQIFEGSDACVAPVLSMTEAYRHPHNVHRQTFVEIAGVSQPAPAPRFSRTPAMTPGTPPQPGEHSHAVLRDWGITAERIAQLQAAGVVKQS